MWPWADLGKLDESTLQKRGLKLRLKDIWTPGKGGLALAVTGLRGCTASFISPEGLLITNHHCAFTAIQRNSTPERDLIKDGFVARNRSQELNGYGARVLVFNKQKDVTREIVGAMPAGLSDFETTRFIEKREKELVARCERTPNTRCRISRENNGLRFLLLENLEIRDVRLVAAPPRGLGEFGGEVDNWHWPRHTMDFALLRAYVSRDGSPGGYAQDNVPYRPKRHLKINRKGIARGDFVMVLGRPYHTARYVTRLFLEQQFKWYYPARKKLFAGWVELLKRTASEIPAARLPTSAMLKALHNSLTHARGMIEGILRRNLLERKLKLERRLLEWAKKRKDPKVQQALNALNDYHRKAAAGRTRDLYIRYLLWGVKLVGFARTLTKWSREQAKPDPAREPGYQARDRDNHEARLKHAQRSLHLEADQRVLTLLIRRFGELPKSQRLAAVDQALKGNYTQKAVRTYVRKLYAETKLADPGVRQKMFKWTYARLKKTNDSMIRLAMALVPDLDGYDRRRKERQGALFRLRRPFLESLIRFQGKRFYPDANASPRVTFAVVAGYAPRPRVWRRPFTSLSGLLKKNTGKPPFNAPANLLAAAKRKDLGPYVSPGIKDVPICFLSNADTTGGNSGSPALDGNGNLVGVNFDRVYENIAGDFGYAPADSRNIMVDIRGILWYLDRALKAKWILEELFGKRDGKASGGS